MCIGKVLSQVVDFMVFGYALSIREIQSESSKRVHIECCSSKFTFEKNSLGYLYLEVWNWWWYHTVYRIYLVQFIWKDNRLGKSLGEKSQEMPDQKDNDHVVKAWFLVYQVNGVWRSWRDWGLGIELGLYESLYITSLLVEKISRFK